MRVRHFGALVALVCVMVTGYVWGQEIQEIQVVPVADPDAAASPSDIEAVTPSDIQYKLEPVNTLANCGWFADFGLYVLQPRWATNQALAVQTPLFGAPASNTAVEFKYGFSASPVINLGFSRTVNRLIKTGDACALGIRRAAFSRAI